MQAFLSIVSILSTRKGIPRNTFFIWGNNYIEVIILKKLLCISILCLTAVQGAQSKNWLAVTALSIDNEGNHITSEDYSRIENIEIKFRLKDFINSVEKNVKKVYNRL